MRIPAGARSRAANAGIRLHRKVAAVQHGQRIVIVDWFPVLDSPGAPSFRVLLLERAAGPHQQRFGGVHGAADQLGALGHRAVVQVAQRQHRAVLLGQPGQHALGDDAVEFGVPVVEPGRPAPAARPPARSNRSAAAGSGRPACGAPRRSARAPSIGGGSVLPRGVHRRQERLRRQVLGRPAVGAPADEVPVHRRQRLVVQRQQRARARPGIRVGAHTPIVAIAARTPTPDRRFSHRLTSWNPRSPPGAGVHESPVRARPVRR